MRAWQALRYGPPEVLTLAEIPSPVPGPGEVLLRVRAIGLNFADCMARQGVYPKVPAAPSVPGMEVSGEVAAAGAEVTNLRPGDRVMAVPIFGGHAEEVCLPAAFAHPLPSTMSFATGAALAVTGLTADHALLQARRTVGKMVVEL